MVLLHVVGKLYVGVSMGDFKVQSNTMQQWRHESIVFGGPKARIFRQRGIFPTKFNWEYNGLQWPNLF